MRPIAAALAIILFTASPALAATVAMADDPEHGCIVTLSGPIADGDTKALLSAIETASTGSRYADTIWYTDYGDGSPPDIDFKTPLTLCLDSPGGSLAEAVRLTEAVHGRLGTMIRPGARCESACALVFMAGGYDSASDAGIVTSRHLHVDGRLGFHAPSLSVPEGQYDATTVARAYQVSVGATETIFRNLVRYRFPPSLAARMHATPPSDMFYVSTVREAARWGISVIGVDAPEAWTDAAIRTACHNLYRATQDVVTSDPDQWSRGSASGAPVRRGDNTFSYEGFGMEAAGTCEGYLSPAEEEYSSARQFWGPARAILASIHAAASFPDAQPPLFFSFLQSFMAYPGDMPLTSLPRGGVATPVTDPGTCHVYTADDSLRDREPCTRTRQIKGDATLVTLFDWPSGARTVLETAGMTRRINGQPARGWYWPEPRPATASDTDCARNEVSGNVFCFNPSGGS